MAAGWRLDTAGEIASKNWWESGDKKKNRLKIPIVQQDIEIIFSRQYKLIQIYFNVLQAVLSVILVLHGIPTIRCNTDNITAKGQNVFT